MAVPSSGTLSMQDIAQERLNSTYGSGNVSGPISMYNLINGGNTGGAVTSGDTYPAINTGCTPNPADGGVALVTALKINLGGEAPGTVNTNLKMFSDANLSSAVNAYVRADLTGNASFDWFEVALTATIGGAVLEHYYQRLAKAMTMGHIYHSDTSGTRLANGTYYLSYANPSNTSGNPPSGAPTGGALKIRVVISNTGTVQTDLSSGGS